LCAGNNAIVLLLNDVSQALLYPANICGKKNTENTRRRKTPAFCGKSVANITETWRMAFNRVYTGYERILSNLIKVHKNDI